MNKELLLKVKAHILEEPRRVAMYITVRRVHNEYELQCAHSRPYVYADELPPCGTVACIAGWTCLLNNPNQERVFGGVVLNNAIQLLQITRSQSERLFYVGCWPIEFITRYNLAVTPIQRAQATAGRIDSFIAEWEHESSSVQNLNVTNSSESK